MKEIAKLPIFWLTPITAKCIWRQPGKRTSGQINLAVTRAATPLIIRAMQLPLLRRACPGRSD